MLRAVALRLAPHARGGYAPPCPGHAVPGLRAPCPGHAVPGLRAPCPGHAVPGATRPRAPRQEAAASLLHLAAGAGAPDPEFHALAARSPGAHATGPPEGMVVQAGVFRYTPPESLGHGMSRCAVGWDGLLCRRGFRGTGSVPLIGGPGAKRPGASRLGAGGEAPRSIPAGGTGAKRPGASRLGAGATRPGASRLGAGATRPGASRLGAGATRPGASRLGARGRSTPEHPGWGAGGEAPRSIPAGGRGAQPPQAASSALS
jgi:hypothetical protein